MHAKIVKGLLRKKNRQLKKRYFYIDLNAGSGIYNGIKGSPIVLLDAISGAHIFEPFDVYLCEINTESAHKLLQTCISKMDRPSVAQNGRMCEVSSFKGDSLCVINKDNVSWVNDIVSSGRYDEEPYYVGMIYSDPNGCETFNNIARLSKMKALGMVDVLMHLSATTIKRVAGVNPNTTRLLDGIQSINKKYWWIRKPYGQFQWTFIIGTNWQRFPNLKTFGFYRIDTPEGLEILNFTHYTQQEAQEQFPNENIRPIANTSNIRLLEQLDYLSSKGRRACVKNVTMQEQLRFTT